MEFITIFSLGASAGTMLAVGHQFVAHGRVRLGAAAFGFSRDAMSTLPFHIKFTGFWTAGTVYLCRVCERGLISRVGLGSCVAGFRRDCRGYKNVFVIHTGSLRLLLWRLFRRVLSSLL